MGNLIIKKLAIVYLIGSVLASYPRPVNAEENIGVNLADAFYQSSVDQPENLSTGPEVEPVVVGRSKWNQKLPVNSGPTVPQETASIENKPLAIKELDPLETKQSQTDGINMKVSPPAIPPAVNLHRNFEGKLVLQPRNLGFEKNYPFQLQNSQGRRLAFVDIENLKVVDPLDFENKHVNILGKLEPISKDKKDLVIRARILRSVD